MNSEERKKLLEELRKQKELLESSERVDLSSNKEESKSKESTMQKQGPSLVLKSGNIKLAGEAPYNTYKQGGFVSALLLAALTFVCEVSFLVISYFIFK